MRIFIVVWLGQLVSLLGSAMTRFVLALWLWERTGQATALVLVGVFTGVSSLLANFVAGPLVDRLSRKHVMIIADLLAGFTTIILLLLAINDQLLPWHIYLASALSGFFGVFHFLALSASITVLIPKKQYTRANSMLSVAQYTSLVGAPAIAGLLIGPIGIVGVMLFDVATFLFAVTTLSLVTIPHITRKVDESETQWTAITFGFRYIFSRPPLRGLLLVIFAFSLLESFSYPLFAPMILARTGGDEFTLGVVQSVLGIGGIIGGIVVTVWGGFRRKIHGVLIGLLLTGLLGDALMGLGTGLPVWLLAAILIEVFIPLAIGSNNAIWQTKVPPEQQGRVFAARSIISGFGEPIALLCAGLLADNLFEAAMMPNGSLAPLFSSIIQPGPGAGMALIVFVCGVLCGAAAICGYLVRSIRQVETLLPDHQLSALNVDGIE